MTVPEIITIDGPAASGKSTLGKKLADYLGYLFFDTGVMYRAVTWAALEQKIAIHDQAAVTALAQSLDIDVRPASQADGRNYDVWAAGKDVTWEIRKAEVDANVSEVSAYPGVRQALSAHQRRIGLRGKVVMVGRDIGTVVLPEARLKIYLEATAEERARRRFEELRARRQPAEYSAILKAVRERDHYDSSRDLSPMRPARDAVILDSDRLTADQVMDKVLEILLSSRGFEPDGALTEK